MADVNKHFVLSFQLMLIIHICHFLQITSLNHLILTATRQKRKCKDMFVANKGRVFSVATEIALSFVRSKWTP